MAIRRIRIDYTVYPPNFRPSVDHFWEFGTITKARLCAERFGPGARIYRNFNQTNKKGQTLGDWWDGRAWMWDGAVFKRIKPSDLTPRPKPTRQPA